MSRQRCGSFEFHRFKGIPLPRQNQTPRKLWFKIGKHYCMTVGVGCDLPPPISIPTSLSRIRGRTPGPPPRHLLFSHCQICCCCHQALFFDCQALITCQVPSVLAAAATTASQLPTRSSSSSSLQVSMI